MRLAKVNKAFRREGVDGGLQSKKHRFRRLQRDLLFKNDVDESFESSGSSPHGRCAVGCEDPGERFVTRGQMPCGLAQSFRG
jgi:hypothetical protein